MQRERQNNSSMMSNERKKYYDTTLSHYVDTFGDPRDSAQAPEKPTTDSRNGQNKNSISYVNSNSMDSNFQPKKLERKGDSINIQIDAPDPSNDPFTSFLRKKIRQTIDNKD